MPLVPLSVSSFVRSIFCLFVRPIFCFSPLVRSIFCPFAPFFVRYPVRLFLCPFAPLFDPLQFLHSTAHLFLCWFHRCFITNLFITNYIQFSTTNIRIIWRPTLSTPFWSNHKRPHGLKKHSAYDPPPLLNMAAAPEVAPEVALSGCRTWTGGAVNRLQWKSLRIHVREKAGFFQRALFVTGW